MQIALACTKEIYENIIKEHIRKSDNYSLKVTYDFDGNKLIQIDGDHTVVSPIYEKIILVLDPTAVKADNFLLFTIYFTYFFKTHQAYLSNNCCMYSSCDILFCS